jgi:hypothetical protein
MILVFKICRLIQEVAMPKRKKKSTEDRTLIESLFLKIFQREMTPKETKILLGKARKTPKSK